MDREKIINTLELNHKLDNEWIRYILVRLCPEKSRIMLYVISCGEVCYLSNLDASKLLHMDLKTYRKHRNDLVSEGLITIKVGKSTNCATEIRKNEEKLAQIIFEGKLCCKEIKNNLPMTVEVKRKKRPTTRGNKPLVKKMEILPTRGNKPLVTRGNKPLVLGEINPTKDININEQINKDSEALHQETIPFKPKTVKEARFKLRLQ
jgi:hypothetical protein